MISYKAENGDCNVPDAHSGKQLAIWVSTQRQSHKKGRLDADYVERLNAVGFVWRLRGATAG